MKVGDRVRKEKVVKIKNAEGTIEKITQDYVIVVWDKINGYWHYTHAQSHNLEVISESR